MRGLLLLPLAVLLSVCAGGASMQSVSVKTVVLAGEAAVLPCHIDDGDDIPLVEWSKDGTIAFVYRQGSEVHEMKDPIFRYRTSLIMDQLKNGNISLRISNVALSDAGTYNCKTIRNKAQKDVRRELVVVAVSKPKLSLVPARGGGVTLQCEANCWFPEPEVTFVDDQGNDIEAEEPKTRHDTRLSGCVNVTRRMTPQPEVNRIFCRVRLAERNQTRVAEIFIPDECTRTCTRTIVIITVAVIVVLLLILAACVAFIHIKYGITVGGQKPPLSRVSSNQSASSGNPDGYPAGNQADSVKNATAELQKKINELESSLHDKDRIIRELNEQLDDLKLKSSPVLYHQGQVTNDNSPSRSQQDVSKPISPPSNNNPSTPTAQTSSFRPKSVTFSLKKDSKPAISNSAAIRHNHSSPALFSDTSRDSPTSPPASASDGAAVTRSMSFSESRPRPKSAKPQRRNTTSGNHFRPLEKLSEDLEPLL